MTVVDEQNEALMEAIEGLVRGEWAELESTLHPYDEVRIDGTRAIVRTHYLISDASGRHRMNALASQLAQQIILFCIPRTAIDNARNTPAHMQAQAYAQLQISAQKLFTQTQATTGEGAELLLYSLLEKSLRIPQIMSKMSFKTSTEMHIHGTDGIHAKLLDNGDLALYWGEAKMYDSASSAIASCFSSIEPFLTGQGEEDEQDLFLMNHYLDPANEEIKVRLLEYFDNGSPKSANVEVRGACLIGFTIKDYPRVPRELEDFRKAIEKSVTGWIKLIEKRITDRQLTGFEIEIFVIPVPSAQEFRDSVLRALGLKPREPKPKKGPGKATTDDASDGKTVEEASEPMEEAAEGAL